jgi:hypothetical protein
VKAIPLLWIQALELPRASLMAGSASGSSAHQQSKGQSVEQWGRFIPHNMRAPMFQDSVLRLNYHTQQVRTSFCRTLQVTREIQRSHYYEVGEFMRQAVSRSPLIYSGS